MERLLCPFKCFTEFIRGFSEGIPNRLTDGNEALPASTAAASSAPSDPTVAISEAPSWHSAQESQVFFQTYGARNTPDQRRRGLTCSIDLLECPRFFSDWDKHIGTHSEGLRAMLQLPGSRQHVAAAFEKVKAYLRPRQADGMTEFHIVVFSK